MNFSGRLSQLKFMDRDTVAQILVLKSKKSDHAFIIANTHLLYNLKRGEIKLGIFDISLPCSFHFRTYFSVIEINKCSC